MNKSKKHNYRRIFDSENIFLKIKYLYMGD